MKLSMMIINITLLGATSQWLGVAPQLVFMPNHTQCNYMSTLKAYCVGKPGTDGTQVHWQLWDEDYDNGDNTAKGAWAPSKCYSSLCPAIELVDIEQPHISLSGYHDPDVTTDSNVHFSGVEVS